MSKSHRKDNLLNCECKTQNSWIIIYDIYQWLNKAEIFPKYVEGFSYLCCYENILFLLGCFKCFYSKFFFVFSDSLKDAGGNISEKTMARHGEMVGVARQLGDILDEICTFSGPRSNRSGHKSMKADINNLVDQLIKKDYCRKLNVERFHPGFENVQLNTLINPVQMKKRLKKHVKKRSRMLRIINARYMFVFTIYYKNFKLKNAFYFHIRLKI